MRKIKQIDFYDEIIVDNFAGGGGASTGIEMAIGRSVDIAINHDPAAIAMHKANHPSTEHYCESVWDVDPVKACKGRKVGLAWFSPDCKHFSKAKGGKPKDKSIRGLAWVTVKWAIAVRPRAIMLENVEEFKTWGPLDEEGNPIEERKGETFKVFIDCLSTGLKDENHPAWPEIEESLGIYFSKEKLMNGLGYNVGYKELIAANYGTPTKRKRFFLVARCDGQAVVFPEPTHGDRKSEDVINGLLKPYVPAAKIIDWDIPCISIFGRKKALAENTLKRIAKGLQKFVIENPEPFIMQIGQTGFTKDRNKSIHEPLTTIVSKAEHCLITPYLAVNTSGHPGGSAEEPIHTITTGGHHALIAPTLIQYHSETTKNSVRGQSVEEPIMTLDSSPRYGLVSAFISKNYAGASRSVASSVDDCVHTITARQCHSLVEIKIDKDTEQSPDVKEFLKKYYGKTTFGDRVKKVDTSANEQLLSSHIIQMNNNMVGTDLNEPINTIVAGAGHIGEVRAFLIKYNGRGIGQDVEQPLGTVVSKDRFGLVTIQGQDYQIVDIGMRMLQPHELFKAQGFPENYIIDKDFEGKAYPKTAQVARCGNAVPPPFANALVRANLPELCDGDDTGRYYQAI